MARNVQHYLQYLLVKLRTCSDSMNMLLACNTLFRCINNTRCACKASGTDQASLQLLKCNGSKFLVITGSFHVKHQQCTTLSDFPETQYICQTTTNWGGSCRMASEIQGVKVVIFGQFSLYLLLQYPPYPWKGLKS